jgi:hypothetical protein
MVERKKPYEQVNWWKKKLILLFKAIVLNLGFGVWNLF